MTATSTWRLLLDDILDHGVRVSQDSAGAAFRGRTSYELIANQSEWPMANPVITCPTRKLGYRFLAAEAAWVLSGSNLLEEIVPYAPNLAKLSDDGTFLYGAYGPKFREELPYVVNALVTDRSTRQAVSMPWRSRPGAWKDVPCTLALQWLIREESTIHTVVSMRSSDVFLGVPYDVHTFSMMTALVALFLRPRLGPLALGTLYLTAGSQHLYELDRETAERCAYQAPEYEDIREDDGLTIAPIELSSFDRPGSLIRHLWGIAERDRSKLSGTWLMETLP